MNESNFIKSTRSTLVIELVKTCMPEKWTCWLHQFLINSPVLSLMWSSHCFLVIRISWVSSLTSRVFHLGSLCTFMKPIEGNRDGLCIHDQRKECRIIIRTLDYNMYKYFCSGRASLCFTVSMDFEIHAKWSWELSC